jgi:hypothetical protein
VSGFDRTPERFFCVMVGVLNGANMPAIDSDITPKHAYRFVLRRYDKAANRSILVQGYAESTHSKAITLNGVTAQTIFVRTKELRDRAMKAKFGAWRDETAEWFRYLNTLGPELEGDEQALYKFLRDRGASSRAVINTELAWDNPRFRATVKGLQAKELLIVTGAARSTRYSVVEVK